MPHRLRSLTAAACCVIIAVAGMITVAAGPAEAVTRRGYTLEHSHLIGETPAGFHVYVNRRATGHTRIARASRAIAAELRRLGLPVTYAGYGNPAQKDGRIEVTAGSYGCSASSEGRTLAVTVSHYGRAAGKDLYVSYSKITVCPSFARSGSRTSLSSALKHEFGHAMGLGHTSYRYRGRDQIMYPRLHASVTDYQAGDRRGLRALAAGTKRVKREIPPVGRQYTRYVSGNIVFSGWSLLKLYPKHRVQITVTDNGHTFYRGSSTVPSRTVNRAFHVAGNHGLALTRRWTGGTHRYCVRATSTVNKRASTNLGCVTWQG